MDDTFIIIISLICSAFFSGTEIAYISVSRLEMELEKQKGSIAAKFYANTLNRPGQLIATLLLGNNISLVVYGIAMAQLLNPVLSEWISSALTMLFVQTIISTLLILVTAEFIPKVTFRLNPNRSLRLAFVPTAVVYYLLYPVVKLINGFSNLVLSAKDEDQENSMTFGRVDIDHYLKEFASRAENIDEIENEIQIFQNALDFSSLKARECMIPRNEITALEIGSSIEELRDTLVSTGYSKILIYRRDIDNIIGYVHASELFKNPQFIKSILLPISIVPETMATNLVLEMLIEQKRSIAVVVDEFGGTSGMITMEDIVEEIFGEIEDEHDKEVLTEHQINEYTFEFAARLEVDYINEQYDLDLPESENYETLGGLIIDAHESIPEEGEVIYYQNFSFEILEESDRRIERVKLTVLDQ